jgi:hypothetical protein
VCVCVCVCVVCVCVCVCVCVSLSVVRCNNNPPHLQREGRKRSEKEIEIKTYICSLQRGSTKWPRPSKMIYQVLRRPLVDV